MDSVQGRPLTAAELSLVQWLLDHGEDDATSHAPELENLRVVGRCPCGCASINFVVDITGPVHVVADFGLRSPPGGVFLFTKDGRLAGLEVYSFGDPITELPPADMLVPLPLR